MHGSESHLFRRQPARRRKVRHAASDWRTLQHARRRQTPLLAPHPDCMGAGSFQVTDNPDDDALAPARDVHRHSHALAVMEGACVMPSNDQNLWMALGLVT